MSVQFTHSWEVSTHEAIAIQERLRSEIILEDRFERITSIAGLDLGFEDNGKTSRAAVARFSFPALSLLESAVIRQPTTFPYIPGLLSFREVPALLEAISILKKPPHLLMCDGQGYAHPRRFGLACHLGLLVDIPSIGVAKSLLIGKHEKLGDERGSWQYLIAEGEIVGAAVRTRKATKPVYVSVGHRMSLDTAIDYAMRCTIKFRLPEPIRAAHRIASDK